MKQPPDKIYLQWHGDGEPDDIGEVDANDVTWCKDKIFPHDIEYVRADESELARLSTELANKELEHHLDTMQRLKIMSDGYEQITRRLRAELQAANEELSQLKTLHKYSCESRDLEKQICEQDNARLRKAIEKHRETITLRDEMFADYDRELYNALEGK